MKLNTKRTILVGFAFLAICAFWQMYDNLIPKILTDTFGVNETVSGVIMAADNILALFLLPLFGGLSDRCNNPLGRRRPFILIGTITAAALAIGLPFISDSYHAAPSPLKMAAFIVLLGLLLIAMGTYRSPAVALMPDITPKPLRSKANAIINLMGAIGGIIFLIITSVLYSSARTEGMDYVSYAPLFIIVACIMLAALVVLMIFVPERKFCAEQAAYEAAHPEEQLTPDAAEGESSSKMPPEVKRSLSFLLASIALWFIGYNAISTWFTTYASHEWNMEVGASSLCLTIATVGAIVSYIPVGNIAARIGRRRTIRFGVALLACSFGAAFLYNLFIHEFHPVLYILFVMVGVAWASINVNSLPMVVEMCAGSDVGKFTGLYYTFSMSAQTITPIVAGALLRYVSYKVLFLYAAIFVGLSFVTMSFVKHGDNKITPKSGLEAFDFED